MTLRFKIQKSVGAAVYIETIKRRARQSSVTDVRFDVDDRRGGPELRILCSTAMAIFFIEEVRRLVTKATSQRNYTLVSDCERAIASTIKAIDEGDRGPSVAIHPAAFTSTVEAR